MALRFFDGMERRTANNSNGNYPWYNGPNVSGSSSVTHESSAWSYRYNHVGAALSTFDVVFSAPPSASGTSYNIADTYVSFYLQRSGTAPSAGDDIVSFRHSSGIKARLQWAGSDTIRLLDTSGSTLGTSTTTLSSATWYRIDVRIGTGASANYEVKINGTSEFSGTGDLTTNNLAEVAFIGNDLNNDWFVDDFVLDDAGYHADGGEFTIATLYPNGNGNYTSWTGVYTDVDDPGAHDNTSAQIDTSSTNNRETVTLDNVPGNIPAGATVDAALIVALLRKDVAPACNCQIIDRLSSTDRDTADFELVNTTFYGSTETTFIVIYTTRPTGGAWTQTDINNWEIGVEHNQSQSRTIYCTAVNANVLFTLPAAGGITYSQLERNFVRGRNRGIMKGVA